MQSISFTTKITTNFFTVSLTASISRAMASDTETTDYTEYERENSYDSSESETALPAESDAAIDRYAETVVETENEIRESIRRFEKFMQQPGMVAKYDKQFDSEDQRT